MSFFRKAYSVVGVILMLEYFAQFFLIACAALARLPGRTVGLTALLFVLLVVQFVLGSIPVPLVSGLHGLNALIMVGLAGALTGRNWAWRPGAKATTAATGQ